jgi:hypothetical protein
MKKILLINLLISFFAINSVFANEYESGPYIGAKISDLSVDLSSYTDGDTTGFLLGYSFSPTSSIELEKSVYDVSLLGIDTEIDIFAVYYAVRTEGEKYLKYKLGYLNEAISNFIISEDDTGFSYGIGAGMNFGEFNLEFEYVKVEEDVSSTNFNLIYNF